MPLIGRAAVSFCSYIQPKMMDKCTQMMAVTDISLEPIQQEVRSFLEPKFSVTLLRSL